MATIAGAAAMRKLQNGVWHTRLETDAPHQTVGCDGDSLLKVSFMPGNGGSGIAIGIKRKDARLLAKRINQCLDATVKK